jgi:hypothetical protein
MASPGSTSVLLVLLVSSCAVLDADHRPDSVTRSEACCDPAEEPGTNGSPTCIEGASCCADGTWACNEGDGSATCAEGQVCPGGCGG